MIKENFQVNIKILKSDYERYAASELGSKNTANSQINNKIPNEYSVIPVKKSSEIL